MILVDSSVWIAAFRRPGSRAFRRLEEIVEVEACTCGVIVQEVLQGVDDPHILWELDLRLALLTYLETTREIHRAAVDLFRRSRRRGIAVHTVDALIMATAIWHEVPVFTLDADFTRVARLERGLKLHSSG